LNYKAFTLIELLIVVAIIGILAAIAVPNFLNAQVRAKVAKTEANQKAVATALEMYYLDHNSYVPMYSYGGATNWNEYASYNSLTTPVSYLSNTSAVNDPFASVQHKDEQANTYDQKFEYTPRKKGMGTSLPAVNKHAADMYFIEGVGPDTVDSIPGSTNYPGKPTRCAPYDPSNGISSKGDIFTAGGVEIPDWVANKETW
jgi:prepilin-type N-terminal cleavage/methylation domain-containing protein